MTERTLEKTEFESHPSDYEMKCILPEGTRYGEGTISADRAHHGEYPVSDEERQRAVEVLERRRAEFIVSVEADDDGCGDGRPAVRIVHLEGDIVHEEDGELSKFRAKIFGGGLPVAASMWRAIKGRPQAGETLLGDRKFIAAKLKEKDIRYGAHTADTHGKPNACGCGMLDGYADAMHTSINARDEITGTVDMFIAGASSNPAVEQSFSVREHLAGNKEYMADASGPKTMRLILESGAIVKELGGPHLEAITIINNEPGTTVDQAKIAEILREEGLPEGIQVFVVDAWRGVVYADAIADIAAEELGKDRDEAYEIAMADFLIGQFATAANLTAGDQPVLLNDKRKD